MDVLQGLPVWIQLVIVLLIAAVLVFMNVGWLLQARSWLEQRQRRPGGARPTTGSPPAASARHDGV